MHPHIVAGILERSRHTSLGAELTLAARGSAQLLRELTRQSVEALHDHGARSPHRPTGAELRDVAAAHRRIAPAPVADLDALADALECAAARLDTHRYGPDTGRPGHGILAAVEHHTPDLRLRYDAVTVIAQHLPEAGMTITAWERTAEPGRVLAAAMLRSLAGRRVAPRYPRPPVEPAPGAPEPLDPFCETTECTVHPAPDHTVHTDRRSLVRAYQEAAAGTTHPHLSRIYQARADALRAR
ncbi:hypothetical protein [Kitasatospora sp. NBC_01300]|uniref:hypothetical protein n=1 Tax=Kitasatospora sp. NBC_01300 TaxID=2903574 RepID=UPI002F90BC03|nr:hypothetical protein OG556_40215 [Kitasatospora sp. NBC_01300]